MNKKLFLILGMLLLFVIPFGSSALTDDLISYYKLDETSGSSVIDSVGTNNGTNNGATINQAGVIGTAYSFDGTNDGINISSISSTSQTYTFSWWAYPTSAGNDRYVFDTGTGRLIIAMSGSSNNISFYDGSWKSFGVSQNLNQWAHYVVILDSSTSKGYLYVNGSKKPTEPAYTPKNIGGGTTIGSNYLSTGAFYTGKYDEIGIWERALTEDEIGYVMNFSYPFVIESPTITLNSPINTYNTTSQTINFNVTVTDDQKVENVSLYIDGVLNETNTSNVNGTYIFTKTFSDGEYNWSILAYDNDSQPTQSATRTFNITKILENSQTFSTPSLGGSPTNLSINVSLRNTLGINYVYLVYDGTNYLGTINNSNDYSIVTYQLTPPVVSTPENKSFYWELYLNDSTTFTSTSNNQTISNLALDNCSTYSYYLYNFTIVDEKLQTFLVPATQNTTAEIDLIVTTLGGTTVATYSKKFEKINPFQICISNNLSNGEEYLIDTEVQYYADNYAQEYYNIQGDILNFSDLHSNITLYSLDNTTSTTFKITYKDENYLPVSDALVTVQRKYISEGVYKTVESPITDSNGETLLHLETDSAIYRFIMSKEGVVLATFDSAGVKCTNSLTGDCNLNFNDLTTSILTEDYTSQGDFTFSISYSNATRTVSTIFSSTGVVDARMNVTLADGNNTYVCSNTLNSNSGTLTCVVPLTFANETIIIRIYKNNEFQGQAMTYLGENSKSLYGSNIVFLTIFLYLTLIGLGIQDNPIISGLFMIIGGILAVSINLVEGGGGFIGASATILWLVIAIIIIMIKGSKRN